MQQTYTYAGVFDDQVARYPACHGRDSNNRCNGVLLQSLFFGRPLAFNDGYLMQHPFLVQSLLDNESFLWTLANCGFVVLLRRTEGPLSGLVDWAKKAGVGTIAGLADQNPDWGLLKDRLDQFELVVKHPSPSVGGVQNGLRRWPTRDTGAAFCTTMQHIFDSDIFPTHLLVSPKYSGIKEMFRRYVNDPNAFAVDGRVPAPRTFWERAVKELFGEDTPDGTPIKASDGRQYMHVANSVYHFSHVGVYEAEGLLLDVNTPVGFTTLPFCLETQRNHCQIQSIPPVKVPSNLFEADRARVKGFLQNKDLIKAKEDYLRSVDEYITTFNELEKVRHTASIYGNELNKFVRGKFPFTLDTFLSLVTGGACTVIGDVTGEAITEGAIAALVTLFGALTVRRVISLTKQRTAGFGAEPTFAGAASRHLLVRPNTSFYHDLVAKFRTQDQIYA